jgi:hypothetical protein
VWLKVQSLQEAFTSAHSDAGSARAEALAAKREEAEAARTNVDTMRKEAAEAEARERGLVEARAKRLEESEHLSEKMEAQLRSLRTESEGNLWAS